MSSIKIRIKRLDAGVLIRLLISHPMETGRRRDQDTGLPVPAHFIRTVKIEHAGRVVADCTFSTAVSRDPYLSVRLRGGLSGETVKVSWVDNLGNADSEQALIP
ncbi:thiosulfate oxidation carrier complex protein SoxZ [Methylococcus sp. EFPC2]|uniref:thiosulfate oxidation carrier complex protein SoxZ n=1 Tax=Methylococcus sp. EFPC2 TaxID=2812648 RepID=UPI001966E904|nr:thiosulfate oxidation carrier complex protein SoxZ [Methylococcus sp. EFPC2]QSA98217.1 thiosulfate oxidation carrier complex protein SoxZ [Methylococcus sp. EFPC2]